MNQLSHSADDDPILIRARRVLADVARVMRTIDSSGHCGDAAARRRIVSLAADLELLVRVLTTSRDALGLELSAQARQVKAISAYDRVRTVSRQYTRDTRRKTCTE
jgi:hypothetical protein